MNKATRRKLMSQIGKRGSRAQKKNATSEELAQWGRKGSANRSWRPALWTYHEASNTFTSSLGRVKGKDSRWYAYLAGGKQVGSLRGCATANAAKQAVVRAAKGQ